MKNKERVENQNGYALLITLLALVLIAVIGLSLITMAMNTARITKSERDNQSSYYIAEAGLVEKRAQINEIARQVFAELKAEYDLIKEPINKKNYKLEEKFKLLVQERIRNSLDMTGNQTYSKQYAESPESIVTVTPDVAQPLKYVITSVGKVPSENGNSKEKTVSQTVEIKMIVPNSTDTIEIPGNNTVHKLKACYAVSTTNSIEYAGGTVNGDMYSRSNIRITNGSINGNVFSDGNIYTNRDIGGAVVAKGTLDIRGGDITGSGYGNGITITNGSVKGNLISAGDLSITGGSISQNAIGNNVIMTNGTVSQNLIAMQGLAVQGGQIQSDAVSHKDVTIKNYPSINKDIVAKDNIYINEDWFTNVGGKYVYGNQVQFVNKDNGSNIPGKKEKKNDMVSYLNQYPTAQSIGLSLPGTSEGCLLDSPSLPDIAISFPATQATMPSDQTIKLDGGSHEVIKNGKLNINNYRIEKTNYHLIMDRDMHFSQVNINEDLTLKIDLQNQHRKLYVNHLNNVQGHIELINPGSLEIIVQNSFNSKGKMNVGGKAKTDDLTIRYAGAGDISLTGESDINGSFYIKRAPSLNIASISNSGIRGDLVIFGNTAVTFGGGASVTENLILAPNSSVTLEGGAAVRGNIIAKSFAINGDGSVTPPIQNSGEWEIPGSLPEIIEVPIYGDGTDFLITDSLVQE